ncbi:MAG: hypothetical protein PHX77_04610 [Candidatus Bipolaricaulis sp.]|nr:hypothetical protein [Candidatus Bipolaricaulis sp.]MDD5646439.1 hypothetical protein [Candidatus Bipolaricaulis sp.]
MGPWSTPWGTFAAWIVVGGSIALVLVRALVVRCRSRGEREGRR